MFEFSLNAEKLMSTNINHFIIQPISFSGMIAPLNRKKFTEREDSIIIQLVNHYGPRNWDQIALLIPGRTGRQCRDRYFNYLVPGYFQGEWTKDEDILLNQKFKEMGRKWSKMKPFFPGRSAISIKNRWEYFLCKYNQNPKNSEKPNSKSNMEDDITTQVNDISQINIQLKPIHKVIDGISVNTQTNESYLLNIENTK